MRVYYFLRGAVRGLGQSLAGFSDAIIDCDIAYLLAYLIVLALIGVFYSVLVAVGILMASAMLWGAYLLVVRLSSGRNIRRMDLASRHNKAAR